jgi:peptidyl-prolyl cis-trans isomerase SurA
MKQLIFAALLAIGFYTQAQTLFTIGEKAITKQEFLTAFNKNQSPNVARRKALDEYKNLYINFKLKLQSALDDNLKDQPTFKLESENFKKQITESIVNDEANIKLLYNEAFARSQKDINVSQIFISGLGDSSFLKVQKAYNELKAGKTFDAVLNTYCNDNSIKNNKGNIGFVTVFSLPYEIENIVYALKINTFSAPYKSAYGWHIFKNIAERPAAGKRQMSQILITFPPQATNEEKQKALSKANEIYANLLKGDNFETTAKELSNDYNTSQKGGDMGEIEIGKYDTEFENKIFSLTKKGEISKPFLSSVGYHILKLMQITPNSKNSNDPVFSTAVKQKIESSDRLEISKKNLLTTWRQKTGYKKAFYNEEMLWKYIDSAYQDKSTKSITNFTDSSVLIAFAKKQIVVVDFVKFVKTAKVSGSPLANKTFGEMLAIFDNICVGDYYRDNIEAYNQTMRQQMKEFDEANLLFAAMDKHIWAKTTEDSIAVKTYYNNNTQKYLWKPSVTAINVTANSKTTAQEIAKQIKANYSDWKSIAETFSGKATIDSNRFELDQLPKNIVIEKKAGFCSAIQNSLSDSNSVSFVYVIQPFMAAQNRSFEEAKGLVMNDYQQVIEQKWIDDIKKKYPVKFNEVVWKTIQ